MNEDMHTHTFHSDGVLSPDALVKLARDAGVTLLSVVDHNTLEHIEDVYEAGARHNVTIVTGSELSVVCNTRRLHLLAYNFRPQAADIRKLLRVAIVRQLSSQEVIAAVHQCGGIVSLAHPMKLLNRHVLEPLLAQLHDEGLDALEVFYLQHTQPETRQLHALAMKFELYETAGSDFHAPNPNGDVCAIGNWRKYGLEPCFPPFVADLLRERKAA